MGRTFIVTSNISSQLGITELHLNLWHVDKSRYFIDIGMDIEVSRDIVDASQNIKASFYSPFGIKDGTVNSLYKELEHNGVLQTIFNDEVKSKVNHVIDNNPHNIGYAVLFGSNRERFIVNPEVSRQDGNVINITINLNGCGSLAKTTKTVEAYIRFRYEVDLKNSLNMFSETRVFHTDQHYDFRFNDRRSFSQNKNMPFSQVVGIKDIYIFAIKPTRYRIVNDAGQNLKYVRLLEHEQDGWQKYMPNTIDSKLFYLVYYWKLSGASAPDLTHRGMLISFEVEISSATKKALTALTLGLISSLLVLLPSHIQVDMGKLSSYIPPLKKGIEDFGGLLFTVFIGVAGNALWTYLKQWLDSRRNR